MIRFRDVLTEAFWVVFWWGVFLVLGLGVGTLLVAVFG